MGRSDGWAPVEDARYSILALGDTGKKDVFAQSLGGQIAVANAMVAEAMANPVDALILLGDNFYWDGLDRENLVPRVRENLVTPYCYFLRLDGPRSSEVEEACRVPERDRVPVPIYAVLGNHDFILPGSPELEREVVPEFLPDWHVGSGLTELIELTDGISLILFESEVDLWDKVGIGREIARAIREAKGPWRILATHRPIATNDEGQKILGGYPEFVLKGIEASGLPVQLVLAGHHHSLQIFETTEPLPALHVGAGSGSHTKPPLAQDHPDVRFSRMALGFARIDLVGRGEEERLVVTLTETADWPILSAVDPPRRVARFEVDQEGRVSSPAPP
ncbi:MAG: metallophosphoesterase [Myxococcota bacterium]|nr:metallophosphoesterase [Myxococcota bacterium]